MPHFQGNIFTQSMTKIMVNPGGALSHIKKVGDAYQKGEESGHGPTFY